MTSPSLTSQPVSQAISEPVPLRKEATPPRVLAPILLFVVTLCTTTAVGMRYMYNFKHGLAPLATDTDILPYAWVFHNLRSLATGLPFSLTLITILLAHEFGHYFACRSFRVRATLPYMLPAPSLSGTFGAIIRLKSRIASRSALIVIAAAGPIAGFVVALFAVGLGLASSHYATSPVLHRVQAPLLIVAMHSLLQAGKPLELLVPHPILSAAWIGILITALNLIPAGQLDGGHIVYALSPALHRLTSRTFTVVLILLGVFYWTGWILWGLVLLTPGMRHPKVSTERPVKPWQYALVPICLVLFVLSATYEPFQGYSLVTILKKVMHHGH